MSTASGRSTKHNKKTPPPTPSKKDEQPKNKGKCGICNKICVEKKKIKSINDESIYCEECGLWFHFTCTNLTEEEYGSLSDKSKNLPYICTSCKDKKDEVFESDDEFDSKQAKFFEKLLHKNNEILFRKLDSVKADIMNSIDQRIDEKLNIFRAENEKMVQEKIQSILDKEVRDQNAKDLIEQQIKIQVTQSLDEARDFDERKNNLIIYNIKETISEDEAISLAADLENVKAVLTHTNPELKDTQIKSISITDIHRMGTLSEPPTQEKPRPIKLVLKNQKTKYQVLKKAKKLKDCESHPKVGIKPDLTKKQQEEEKKLKTDLEERRKNNEDVMIFKKQIILRKDLAEHKKQFLLKKSQSASDKPPEKKQ